MRDVCAWGAGWGGGGLAADFGKISGQLWNGGGVGLAGARLDILDGNDEGIA